jgi:hypothetical protein
LIPVAVFGNTLAVSVFDGCEVVETTVGDPGDGDGLAVYAPRVTKRIFPELFSPGEISTRVHGVETLDS